MFDAGLDAAFLRGKCSKRVGNKIKRSNTTLEMRRVRVFRLWHVER